MNMTVINYLVYLAVTVPLTIWVARALQRHGGVFLVDVFHGDAKLATSVNQLLVIGFYLLNFGYVAFFMKGEAIDNSVNLMEIVVRKIGGVSLMLGLVHLVNVWAFNTFRKRAVREAAGIPPVHPDSMLLPPPPVR
jgi:hypothetical protein